jgi:hypothetical protein
MKRLGTVVSVVCSIFGGIYGYLLVVDMPYQLTDFGKSPSWLITLLLHCFQFSVLDPVGDHSLSHLDWVHIFRAAILSQPAKARCATYPPGEVAA